MTIAAHLASLQQAYADATEEGAGRLDEVRPPDLPAVDGGETTAMQVWQERHEAIERKIADLQAQLDTVTHG